MSKITLPNGYNNAAVSNDGNTLTVYHETSTVRVPRFMVITRKRSDYNSKSQTFSVPTYRIRVIHGFADAESGLPHQERTLIDADVRFPVNAPDADLATVISDFSDFVSQVDLDESFKSFLLPCISCDTDPEE